MVGWGGLLVLYLEDVIAERYCSSMVFHGDLIEIFHSLRYRTRCAAALHLTADTFIIIDFSSSSSTSPPRHCSSPSSGP